MAAVRSNVVSPGDMIRRVVRHRTRRRIARARVRSRQPSAALRTRPDFMIIGAQRSGTSSLYRWLGGHPQVIPSLRKETEYFSALYGEGEQWYRSHFPLQIRRRRTFEATPDYLFDPRAPSRIKQFSPDIRLIVLLRQPEKRTISHYRHMVRHGYEDLPLAQALETEESRLRQELIEIKTDPLYRARDLSRYSYLARSRYSEQFERWFRLFDRGQFCILRSEDLFGDPKSSFSEVLRFLDLEDWSPGHFRNHSYLDTRSAPTTETSDADERLVATYLGGEEPRLAELLGSQISWTHGSADSTGTCGL